LRDETVRHDDVGGGQRAPPPYRDQVHVTRPRTDQDHLPGAVLVGRRCTAPPAGAGAHGGLAGPPGAARRTGRFRSGRIALRYRNRYRTAEFGGGNRPVAQPLERAVTDGRSPAWVPAGEGRGVQLV